MQGELQNEEKATLGRRQGIKLNNTEKKIPYDSIARNHF